MEEYNVIKATEAQRNYIERTGSPKFPPSDGNCWSCRSNIYEPIERTYKNFAGETKVRTTGITVEEAGEQLVTGCPHCNRSYCD